jgi:hypothetical protein
MALLAGAAGADDPPPSALPEIAAKEAAPAGGGEKPAGCEKPAEGKKPAEGEKPKGPDSIWAKVPPVRPLPRPGLFLVLPQGPGYYSFEDWLTDDRREKRPQQPYSAISFMMPSFFEADFRYLDKPDNTQHHWTDWVKRLHPCPDWMLTFGGEERVRYMNEVSRQLSGLNNEYTLLRSRVFADLWYRDRLRLYAEFLDAQSFNEELPPLTIDEDRADMLNFFFDVKVGEVRDRPVYFRGGRQELLYGSQRLISPPDWANTRRTFNGVKLFRAGEKLDADLFWVQPVIPDPSNFDSVDNDQNFAGAWFTYKPRRGTTLDLYYLFLDQARHVAQGRGGVPGAFNVSTVGARYAGDYEQVLWDFEGMYQFGDWSNQTISAGAYTTSVGYQFAKAPMNPQFWVAYDWAAGDHNPGRTGTHGTFNQLFPFGHYYLGYLDLVGRQNISDFNMQFVFFPAKWVTGLVQYHNFRLDSSKDALFNAFGAPIRRDPTGRAGGDVGEEIDFYVNFHLTQNQDVLVGYSKLFAGEFIKRTGSPLSPELFYFQYSFRW